jgi:hypothetical protein
MTVTRHTGFQDQRTRPLCEPSWRLPPRVEDSAGGPERIGVRGREAAGIVWATADRPPRVRTEVGAMSRSFKDMARTVRSAH